MKNLNIYKSILAVLSASSILLVTGCTSAKPKNNKENESKSCVHLTLIFEDEPITFKECEGYDIHKTRDFHHIDYVIFKNNEPLLKGTTKIENLYYVNHNIEDEHIENKPIQKIK